MAAREDDFLMGDDLDDLFFLLEGGHLDIDDTFNQELDVIVSEVAADDQQTSFTCEVCNKICKSKRGLTRHTNAKHKADTSAGNSTSSATENNAGVISKDAMSFQKLSQAKLHEILKESCGIVVKDMCLPESTRQAFFNCTFTFDEIMALWEKLRPLIDEHTGDGEKFFTGFYGLLDENLLPSKFHDITLTNILMMEVGNLVLIHLDSGFKNQSQPEKKVSPVSENEIKCLQYVSGYIIHKLHNKFRFSKSFSKYYNRQCVAILKACKVDVDHTQTLVNIRDRGGLWRVNKLMQDLFLTCENIFRSKTSNHSSKIICEEIVKTMFENSTIRSKFKTVCYDVDPKVNSEISLNLLEQILTLFVRMRTFSYARDIREKHLASKKKGKKRALRTDIKITSSTTDTGGH